jgi:hypothetical protein
LQFSYCFFFVFQSHYSYCFGINFDNNYRQEKNNKMKSKFLFFFFCFFVLCFSPHPVPGLVLKRTHSRYERAKRDVIVIVGGPDLTSASIQTHAYMHILKIYELCNYRLFFTMFMCRIIYLYYIHACIVVAWSLQVISTLPPHSSHKLETGRGARGYYFFLLIIFSY